MWVHDLELKSSHVFANDGLLKAAAVICTAPIDTTLVEAWEVAFLIFWVEQADFVHMAFGQGTLPQLHACTCVQDRLL